MLKIKDKDGKTVWTLEESEDAQPKKKEEQKDIEEETEEKDGKA